MSGECIYCGEHVTDCACDCVNHPSHYQGASMEVIEIIEDFELNFRLGNAIKYILRCNKKGNPIEDLEKAAWYINRELMLLRHECD